MAGSGGNGLYIDCNVGIGIHNLAYEALEVLGKMENIVKDIGYGEFLKEGFSRIDAIYETTNTICENIPEMDRDTASMLAVDIVDSLVKQFDDLCKQHHFLQT